VEEAKIMIGSAYEKKGENQKAIAALQKALAEHPEGKYASKAETYMAEIYLSKLKNVAKAVETYQKIADNAKYDYDSRKISQYQVGNIYEIQGNIAKAIEAYKKLIEGFAKPMSKPGHPADKIDKAYILNLQQKMPAQPAA